MISLSEFVSDFVDVNAAVMNSQNSIWLNQRYQNSRWYVELWNILESQKCILHPSQCC